VKRWVLFDAVNTKSALAATIVVLFALPLSGCKSSTDENGFLKHTERAYVRHKTASVADEQWWQANQDRVLSAGQASCDWLEEQPEVGDELQGPTGPMLRSQYLDESETINTLSERQRFNSTVIEYAWAYLCIDTRNSRTSLPPGIYEED
jgi:hypothetical protein